MRNLARLVTAIIGAAALAGCGTKGNVKTGEFDNTVPRDYYNQPNATSILSVRAPTNGPGVSLTLTISNAQEICINTLVPVKQMMPREPTWLDSFSGLVKELVWPGVVGYVATHSTVTPTPSLKGPTTISVPSVAPLTP